MTPPSKTNFANGSSRMRLTFGQLKRISVIVPVAGLTMLLYVAAFALPDVLLTPPGFLASVALIVAGAVVFSHLVFDVIRGLEREIVAQRDRSATAATVATKLSEAEGTRDILQQVLDAVADSFAVETGVICLLDEAADELYLCAHRGLPAPLIERVRRQAVDDDPIGNEVIRDARPVVVADASLDPRSVGLAEQFGLWSYVSVPLLAEGRALGVLALASTTKARFSDDDVSLLEQVARQLGIAVQRTSLLEQLVARNEELRVLNDVSSELARARELQAAATAALAGLLEVSDAGRAELWLDERGEQVFVNSAERRPMPPGSGGGARQATEAVNLRRRVAKSGKAELVGRGQAGVGCFPLHAAGQVFGLFVLEGIDPAALTLRRRQLIDSIVDQGAVAISNARFRERVRELAVLEERERIAREMHDGLAQVLGYVNTKAFAVRRLLTDGDTGTAVTMLTELEEAAREVYADVREGVLALRETAPGDRSLLDSVCEYLAKFERLSGIHVECHADRRVADLRLPEMSEIQIMRVVQEALSNVRKHAAATNASLTLRARDGTLIAEVQDDGCGFEVRTAGRRNWPQFGLRTMRERAEAIGGRFSVRSSPGHGTRVVVRIPLKGPVEARA